MRQRHRVRRISATLALKDKNVLSYYKRNNTSMFLCYMDASKAFDRVNHGKLFNKLINRQIPLYLVRIIIFWYTQQQLFVKWGHETLETFLCTNGVRQGGILSPLLFNVYIDEISVQLNKLSIGCLLGGTIINHLIYADDLIIFSPSVKGLQQLLDCCIQYGEAIDIKFNDKKTKSMVIRCEQDKCKVPFPDLLMDAAAIENVLCHRYLGVFISCDLKDNEDIKRQIRSNYARANMLTRNFHYCSEDVKKQLFTSYMYNMYCASLWCVFNQSIYDKLIVSYNNTFRFLFAYARHCSASHISPWAR